ncbi:DUF805 domain-containing protein [Sinomonas sp. G460-2]|uniref:DUF805 domain-containing protein n=1 Tax=Sinomonas sp. G460-2 TaxID=3393464 RepID=UPI0039F08360
MSYPQHPQDQTYAAPTQVEPPLWAPFYGASPVQAIGRFFAKYAVFHGRASRAEYWWVALACTVVGFVLEVLPFVLDGASRGSAGAGFAIVGYAYLALFLGTIVPSLSVTARRLHDANLSGWLMLLLLIPLVGGIAVLVLMLLSPNPAGQRFDRPTAPRQGEPGA